MDRIDFRSDTVSWPTPAMRAAMATVKVGDDVYGEDPTVNELEALAAQRTGKEAALFVASGTMGNLAAVLSWAGRGDEAILGHEAHVFQWEAGGMAALGGVMPHTVPTDPRGCMDPHAVAAAVRDDDAHLPRTRLLLLENTFGGRGGYPLPPEYFASMRAIADRYELAVHLDGARLFNAAVALGVDARELTRDVDSVTFCLSKGLCAPVGSLLCGSHDFIARARRARKSLGGGMRQAGILAAAGLISLTSMIDRLTEDHAHARRLAEGLAHVPGIEIDLDGVRTNIVHSRLVTDAGIGPQDLVSRLRAQHGVLLGSYPPDLLRAVTHYWVGPREVDALVQGVRAVLAGA